MLGADYILEKGVEKLTDDTPINKFVDASKNVLEDKAIDFVESVPVIGSIIKSGAAELGKAEDYVVGKLSEAGGPLMDEVLDTLGVDKPEIKDHHIEKANKYIEDATEKPKKIEKMVKRRKIIEDEPEELDDPVPELSSTRKFKEVYEDIGGRKTGELPLNNDGSIDFGKIKRSTGQKMNHHNLISKLLDQDYLSDDELRVLLNSKLEKPGFGRMTKFSSLEEQKINRIFGKEIYKSPVESPPETGSLAGQSAEEAAEKLKQAQLQSKMEMLEQTKPRMIPMDADERAAAGVFDADEPTVPTVPDEPAVPVVPDEPAAPTVPDEPAAPAVPDISEGSSMYDILKTYLPTIAAGGAGATLGGILGSSLEKKLRSIVDIPPEYLKKAENAMKNWKKAEKNLVILRKIAQEALKRYNQPTGSNSRDRENQNRLDVAFNNVKREEQNIENKTKKVKEVSEKVVEESEKISREKKQKELIEKHEKEGHEREARMHKCGIIRQPRQCLAPPNINITNKINSEEMNN